MTSAEFAIADPILLAPFYRYTGGLFENVNMFGLDVIRQRLYALLNTLLYKLGKHGFANVRKMNHHNAYAATRHTFEI